jgi:hypothetical protein
MSPSTGGSGIEKQLEEDLARMDRVELLLGHVNHPLW